VSQIVEAGLEGIKARAQALLARFADPAAQGSADELRPDPSDYAAVFLPAAVDAARAAYQVAWLQSPRPTAQPGQTEVRVFAAPASFLADDNELSRRFPGGYRRIAHLLEPTRIWLSWKFVAPGASSGMAYDGLVWLDGRFAWFPKPWRALGELAMN